MRSVVVVLQSVISRSSCGNVQHAVPHLVQSFVGLANVSDQIPDTRVTADITLADLRELRQTLSCVQVTVLFWTVAFPAAGWAVIPESRQAALAVSTSSPRAALAAVC